MNDPVEGINHPQARFWRANHCRNLVSISMSSLHTTPSSLWRHVRRVGEETDIRCSATNRVRKTVNQGEKNLTAM